MTNKKWYQSKTKWGVLLLGLSAILGTVGGWLSGSIGLSTAITALIAEVGAVFGLFGIRDLPLINQINR